MKNYLKEKLSQEERLIILGIIWKVARKYKGKYYNDQKRYCEIIDNIDLSFEDTYTFYKCNLHSEILSLTPLTDEQKCDIVMEFDSLLRESCLFELIRALTFNEKLVFFLFYLKDYKNIEVATLLNNSERTILNRRKSIDNKIKKMKGEL